MKKILLGGGIAIIFIIIISAIQQAAHTLTSVPSPENMTHGNQKGRRVKNYNVCSVN